MHLVKVDEVCKNCGYHNKCNDKMDEFIEIIACGRCGNIMHAPTDFDEDDKKAISKLISGELKNDIL